MAPTRSRGEKFGATILTPYPTPATYTEAETKRTPRPKIVARDRLLKPAPSTNQTRVALARNQRNATFFELPAEIRSRIYALALGNRYVRIEYEPHRHRIRQIDRKRYREHVVGGLWCHSHDLTSSPIANIKIDRPRPKLRRLYRLTLPSRTCRQMYADTVLLHFELNVFSFENAWVMRKWMLQLKPVQKRALRRLDLIRTDGMSVTLGKQLTGLNRVWFDGTWMDVQRFWDHIRQRKAKEEEEKQFYESSTDLYS